MAHISLWTVGDSVAIPLEQGRFFNINEDDYDEDGEGRNPFGAGTVFQ